MTTAAQLGVAPVLLATFGTVPLVALPANLLAAPFVGPLTIWGLVVSAVGGVLGPGVARWLQLPTLAMLRSVELDRSDRGPDAARAGSARRARAHRCRRRRGRPPGVGRAHR